MSCSGSYATAEDFAGYFCIVLDDDEIAGINSILKLAATPIHAARAASAGCDCTLADWATDFLVQLNCMYAVAVYNCKCSNLRIEPDMKRAFMENVRADLVEIRNGNIELCSGETAAEYPALAFAERTLTPFSTAQILRNEILRRDN